MIKNCDLLLLVIKLLLESKPYYLIAIIRKYDNALLGGYTYNRCHTNVAVVKLKSISIKII